MDIVQCRSEMAWMLQCCIARLPHINLLLFLALPPWQLISRPTQGDTSHQANWWQKSSSWNQEMMRCLGQIWFLKSSGDETVTALSKWERISKEILRQQAYLPPTPGARAVPWRPRPGDSGHPGDNTGLSLSHIIPHHQACQQAVITSFDSH